METDLKEVLLIKCGVKVFDKKAFKLICQVSVGSLIFERTR